MRRLAHDRHDKTQQLFAHQRSGCRLEIEAQGKAELKAAENEARALNRMGRSYRDNQAVLRYELELRRLDVAEKLVRSAPRPVMVNSRSEDGSALSTLILAQILPRTLREAEGEASAVPAAARAKGAPLSPEVEPYLPRFQDLESEPNGPVRGRPRRS
jgi:hypothetical protein